MMRIGRTPGGLLNGRSRYRRRRQNVPEENTRTFLRVDRFICSNIPKIFVALCVSAWSSFALQQSCVLRNISAIQKYFKYLNQEPHAAI